MYQTQVFESEFDFIAKKKSANFSNNCLGRARAKGIGIDKRNVPMPNEIYDWLKYRNKPFLQCDYTGKRIDINDIQIDHKIPIARGGTFDISNLAITTPQVNQQKGCLTDAEFKKLLNFLDGLGYKTNVLKKLRRGNSILYKKIASGESINKHKILQECGLTDVDFKKFLSFLCSFSMEAKTDILKRLSAT